jgi:hypothetical protein
MDRVQVVPNAAAVADRHPGMPRLKFNHPWPDRP